MGGHATADLFLMQGKSAVDQNRIDGGVKHHPQQPALGREGEIPGHAYQRKHQRQHQGKAASSAPAEGNNHQWPGQIKLLLKGQGPKMAQEPGPLGCAVMESDRGVIANTPNWVSTSITAR